MSGSGGDFGGMTVNERLFAAGLVEQFDTAITEGNRQLAVDILQQVAINAEGAWETVDAVLADPFKYGYQPPS